MFNEVVGKKIRELRQRKGDSLKELAEKIDYDYSNLSKAERGLYNTSVELLNKIINVYQVPPSYFFGDDFSESERKLLDENELNLSDLKNKYQFTVDGVKATDKEIEDAIRLIRQLRGGD